MSGESKKRTWSVYAVVAFTMHVGDIEAESEDEAREWGEDNAAEPSLCHACSRHAGGDLSIDEIVVEEQQ